MTPDRILERIKEFGTRADVAKAEHKHRDVSRILHDDLAQFGDKFKALSSIMVGLEKTILKDCGIASFRECETRTEQIEVRYKHTEVEPLYHRIALDFVFLEGADGKRYRITDLPLHSDWFEMDIYELERALAASAQLWLDRLGISRPLTAENVAYY